MKMTIKEDTKLATEQSKYKKYCEFCGHTISFYAFEKNKKLCSWCGNYNYKNQLVKFKELLIKKKRKLEICREEI